MYSVRPAKESDKAFIYSTFLRGVYYGHPFFTAIEKSAFFAHYPRVLDKLLSVADVQVLCLSEDQDLILGFSITRPNIIDYVFVKPAWRKQGLAKLLLPGTYEYVTHITRPGEAIAKSKKLKVNPFLL